MRRDVKATLTMLFSAVVLAAGSVPAWAQSGTRYTPPRSPDRQPPAPRRLSPETPKPIPLALEGHCPVALKDAHKWAKGSPAYRTVYDGRMYHFRNDQARRMFLANPAKYAPVLGGDCVICYAKMGQRVPGNIRHAMYHEGRLYLFASEEQKEMFAADPTAYENTDLALEGECTVCRIDMGQQVPGKPEFSVHHDGLRYLFPAAQQRDKFLADPQRYAVRARAAAQPHVQTKGSSSR